jgi:glycosyltransferase involved in cell wall biosynthesis
LKKILFILHLPPPVHGSSVIGQFIQESKVINSEFSCRFINLSTSTNFNNIGKVKLYKFYKYLAIIIQSIKQLIFFRPHLCYFAITVKGIGFYKDALIVMIVKIFGVKLVYHFHNKGVSTKQHKFFDNLLYRFVFNKVNIILLSKFLYRDIKKYVSENSIHYCPNGIPNIAKNIKIKSINKKIINILYFSNMIESKGVFVLLNACNILKNKEVEYKCTFAGGYGDINEKQFKLKLQELRLQHRVTYVGKKFGAEKIPVFLNADIFAFPTYYETFGLVNLEAMQYELPVISTFEGGIPDIVIDGITGFLVRQKDSYALAEKLELLIHNKNLREKMGKKGKMHYQENFTLKHFENKMNKILNLCLVNT